MHQFNMVVKGDCEVVVCSIQAVLDVHLNWMLFQVDVANAFNTISWKAIF
jgi:hypothetical protein